MAPEDGPPFESAVMPSVATIVAHSKSSSLWLQPALLQMVSIVAMMEGVSTMVMH